MNVPVGVWQLIDALLDSNISLSHLGPVVIPTSTAKALRNRGWEAIRAHPGRSRNVGGWPPEGEQLELDVDPFEWDLIRRMVADNVVDARTNPYYRPDAREMSALEALGAYVDATELIENPPEGGFRTAHPPVEFEEPLEPGDIRGLREKAEKASERQVPEPARCDEHPDSPPVPSPPLPRPRADQIDETRFLVVRSDFEERALRRPRIEDVP